MTDYPNDDDQPSVPDEAARIWLADRYDNGAMPPGAASFVIGKDWSNQRPWERSRRRHLDADDHLAARRR